MENGSNLAWINTKLNDIHSKNPDVTTVLLLTKEEIKKGTGLVFLGHLIHSKEFRLDLNMANTYWFYHQTSLRRCLLV